MKGLKNFAISGPGITDKSLIEVAKAKALLFLDLRVAKQITDHGLSALEGTHLYSLNLESTPIDDAGMVHLSKMPNLKTIILKKTNVTIDGIKELCKNKKSMELIQVEDCPNLKEGDRRLLPFPALRFK